MIYSHPSLYFKATLPLVRVYLTRSRLNWRIGNCGGLFMWRVGGGQSAV